MAYSASAKICFDRGQGKYARFVSFHGHRANDLHMYFPGIRGKTYRLAGTFQDLDNLTEEEIDRINYKTLAFERLKPMPEMEYISCHPQDCRFHIKLTGFTMDLINTPRLTDPSALRFVDFLIISDKVGKYRIDESDVGGATSIATGPEEVFVLRGAFSVGGFDLRDHPVLGERIRKLHNRPALCFTFLLESKSAKPFLRDRPAGTIVNFLFPKDEGRRYQSKSVLIV